MKKYIILLLIISLFMVTACGKEKSNIVFKNDYESINGKTNSHGSINRTITIPEDNPFEEVSASEIVKMIENKETFYVYFGSKLCPWCRSVIEKATELAKTYGISKIYYVDIWDDEGNEIVRDKYKLVDGKPVLEKEGTDEYKKLLEYFNDYLRDYTLTDDNNNVSVGEKRIYAPNFIFIENGVTKKLVTGKSDKLTNPNDELTDEILKDQDEIFTNFFSEVCDEEC